MRTTNLFLVLNEETMQVEMFNTSSREEEPKMVPRMFATEKEANDWASHTLNMWDVVNSHFEHEWLQHVPNQSN